MLSTIAAWMALFLFAGTMIYAGVKDAATMMISNRLVALLSAAYLVFAPATGLGLGAMSISALAAAATLLCTISLFTLGWIGGGDAKLIPVVVLWLGHGLALDFILYASMFGAVLTLVILQLRNFSLPTPLRRAEWSSRLHRRDVGIPYGIALALAALSVLPESHWYAAVL